MAGPSHHQNVWFRTAAAVMLVPSAYIAVAVTSCGERRNSFAALDERARKEVAALRIHPYQSATVERGWFGQEFDSNELVAPIGPPPCPQAAEALPYTQRAEAREAFETLKVADKQEQMRRLAAISARDRQNFLVALIAGSKLVENGESKLAEQLLWSSLDSTDRDNQIIQVARSVRLGHASPILSARFHFTDDELATVIHLHHVLGVAELRPSPMREPWVALKNVIGSVRPLGERHPLGLIPGQGPESRLVIPAPGCSDPSRSITSYDLYNNLIVGYVRGNFHLRSTAPNVPQTRENEFHRDRRDVETGVRQLFVAQREHERDAGWPNESRLWALSNADSVLDQGVPDDARLDYTIARLLNWWMDPTRCPAEICTHELQTAVKTDRDVLLRQALNQRDVDPDQRESFAAGMVKMIVFSDIDPASVKEQLNALRDSLSPAQARILDDYFAAQAARDALPSWALKSNEVNGRAPWQTLGEKAATWRPAVLQDFAMEMARWAQKRSPKEKRRVAAALRRLLEPEPLPAEVDRALVPSGVGRWEFEIASARRSWTLLGIVVAGTFWLVIVWILLQLREALLLRRSFYELELEFIDNIDASVRRR